jgi:hypothetical protein
MVYAIFTGFIQHVPQTSLPTGMAYGIRYGIRYDASRQIKAYSLAYIEFQLSTSGSV